MQILTCPWEANTGVMWVSEVMIPINGKFYLNPQLSRKDLAPNIKYLVQTLIM